MQSKPALAWDPRRDKEIRTTLSEIKTLEESGYFDGLGEYFHPPALLEVEGALAKQIARSAPFVKKVTLFKPLDYPVVPPFSQFMSQISVGERTDWYKTETHRLYNESLEQVKILFGKIGRGEISSNSVIRTIIGGFIDTFMKDRNLILNLASAPYAGKDYLFDHSLKICLLSLSLASAAGYSRAQSIDIAQGALLADVGMMLVPEQIRMKQGKLNEGELFEMKKHPMYSLTLLEHVHGLSEATLIIPIQHHERISGSGYPDNKIGAGISKFSRIVAIADVFTAMVNHRTYREPVTPYQAMVALLSMGGQGLLDSDQIKQFLRTLSIFPIGSLVRLSNGCIAKVIAPNAAEYTKPTVSVLSSESGIALPLKSIYQIDLGNSDTKISEALANRIFNHHLLDGF